MNVEIAAALQMARLTYENKTSTPIEQHCVSAVEEAFRKKLTADPVGRATMFSHIDWPSSTIRFTTQELGFDDVTAQYFCLASITENLREAGFDLKCRSHSTGFTYWISVKVDHLSGV